jgi:hypothetical protein
MARGGMVAGIILVGRSSNSMGQDLTGICPCTSKTTSSSDEQNGVQKSCRTVPLGVRIIGLGDSIDEKEP